MSKHPIQAKMMSPTVASFGHWEGDLCCLNREWPSKLSRSLVERVQSRHGDSFKNPNKRTKPVMGKILKAIKDLPHIAPRSITFDRGSEFRPAAIAGKNWYTKLGSATLVTLAQGSG